MEPVKRLLLKIGPLLGKKGLLLFNSSLNYLELGQWIKEKGFCTNRLVGGKRELFNEMASQISEKRVLYLEFGVSSGQSMRYWSNLLKNPNSHLHGFDTFQGLPFGWQGGPVGEYTRNGQAPKIDDPRVQFFVGLFEETLPQYLPPEGYEVLVINIDCDLYSSTMIALNKLADYIRPGTYIYFDEFPDRSHELRAFDDFMISTGKRFTLFAATKSYGQVAFECC
jgi:hypothetical protein